MAAAETRYSMLGQRGRHRTPHRRHTHDHDLRRRAPELEPDALGAQRPCAARGRRVAARDRQLRADRQQHHLCRVRRRDELLGLLPDRRRRHRLHPGLGLRGRDRVALRGCCDRRALLRLLPDRGRGGAAADACQRGRVLRRRGAPPRAARGLQPLPALQRRSGLRRRARGRAGAAAPAVLHLVPDRRLSRRQRLFRRAHGDPVERVEQDRVRHRVLPRAAARRGRCDAHRRADLARQPRVHAQPRLL